MTVSLLDNTRHLLPVQFPALHIANQHIGILYPHLKNPLIVKCNLLLQCSYGLAQLCLSGRQFPKTNRTPGFLHIRACQQMRIAFKPLSLFFRRYGRLRIGKQTVYLLCGPVYLFYILVAGGISGLRFLLVLINKILYKSHGWHPYLWIWQILLSHQPLYNMVLFL